MKGGNAVNELNSRMNNLNDEYDNNNNLQLNFSTHISREGITKYAPNLQLVINYIRKINVFLDDVLDKKKGKCGFLNDPCEKRLDFYNDVWHFFTTMEEKINSSIGKYKDELKKYEENRKKMENLVLPVLYGSVDNSKGDELDEIVRNTFSDDTFDNIENKITKTQAKLPNKGHE